MDSQYDGLTSRKKYLGLLRYISRKYQILPLSFVVQEIRKEGRNPVAGGGFAVSTIDFDFENSPNGKKLQDIWRGTLVEKSVCLKVLRIAMEQDKKARDGIRKVSRLPFPGSPSTVLRNPFFAFSAILSRSFSLATTQSPKYSSLVGCQ